MDPENHRVYGWVSAASMAAALTAGIAGAAPGSDSQEKAAGILSARCLSCHSAEKKAGGIDLSTRTGAASVVRGGGSAPSRLVRAISSGKMPPTGKLPAPEIAVLRRWIAAGAPYTREPLSIARLSDTPLWSLSPIRRPAVPRTSLDRLARNAVDRFVFQKLGASGLRPSPPAQRLALLRRVTFDLAGLPPAPDEVAAFLADRSPQAYEKVVHRLLASPAYGERWAQHWLDVARYGESHGYEQNHLRPNAWPYRDYVIRAFNDDVPYPRFIAEQLAGDVLAPADPMAQAATGFLVAGVHDTVGNKTEEGTRQQRANDLDDIVSATGEAFLGLTVGCAKCHDHKFDPIPQRDYYRLAAVFAGVRHGERDLSPTGAPSGRHAVTFTPVKARFVRFTITATADGSQPCIDELDIYEGAGGPNLALSSAGAKASASSLLAGYPIHQVAHLNDGKLGNDHSWISAEPGRGWAQIELREPAQVSRVVWSRDAGERRFQDRVPSAYRIEVSEDGSEWKLAAAREGVEPAPAGAVTKAYAGQFGSPDPTYLLKRGDVMQRDEQVTPAGLSRIPGFPAHLPLESGVESESARRVALARWLADPRNPLTARVMVNRVWHHHFGRGIVATPSDFGHNGEPPSHPEMLDWLASGFMKGGWSLKALHRLLVTSYVYRQTSAPNPRGSAVDAGNRLLWRMPLRRLEAEAVRDSILALSGRLDRKQGGPGFRLYRYRVVNVAIYEPLEEHGPETWRRSVYRQDARGIRDGLLGTLDCPESAQRTPRRPSTTTALQALSLINGPFTIQQAGLFAERLRKEAPAGDSAQVHRAFVLAFGRAPSSNERQASLELVRAHGLGGLCRALFNSNEFLYY